MNEAVIADIDADVGKASMARIEKYQVTGPQAVARNFAADVTETRSLARQNTAGHFLEHVADETAAIEPGLGRAAAKCVAHPHEIERVPDQ